MKYASFEEIRTPRLLLRKINHADTECYYRRISGSADVAKYMLWQAHASQQEAYAAIEKVIARFENGSCYSWGIALAEDNSIIGRIDLLRFDETAASCSFAYMLGTDYWGQGYGTEALTAVFDFAFRKMQVKCISADHMRENVASGKAMQKAGMHYVKTIPAKYEKCGKVYDADEYTITSDEWLHGTKTTR